jgi:hypothetical protein
MLTTWAQLLHAYHCCQEQLIDIMKHVHRSASTYRKRTASVRHSTSTENWIRYTTSSSRTTVFLPSRQLSHPSPIPHYQGAGSS